MLQKIGLLRIYEGLHTRYACDTGRIEGQMSAHNIPGILKFKKN